VFFVILIGLRSTLRVPVSFCNHSLMMSGSMWSSVWSSKSQQLSGDVM